MNRKLICIAVVTVWGLIGVAHLEARCPSASLKLDKPLGKVGDTVKISGERFAAVCNDVGQRGVPPGLSGPAKGVKIFFVQGQVKALLATVDADEKFQFLVTVTVPVTAVPGAARLVSEGTFVGDGPTQLWIAPFTVDEPQRTEVAPAPSQR